MKQNECSGKSVHLISVMARNDYKIMLKHINAQILSTTFNSIKKRNENYTNFTKMILYN